ncbi:gliding motility-associated C-terminal domain-containing protein [Ornithobacterium rhinotracheale]|uniref:T9SS type B sorting domain-containing protein n=1 Tax=Ornithobacterium rhinotracheale (strain ATCC 51463 / DSM 15997 / CCUG 23171 / CIP 104009 / LMG 9086) TaxID=867902 RepID=I4A2W0_ORNRL|nr:gliding motility-associated C-terminal domain-containing protein [Ornithobacterium rhinotracheale]AFL98294.1 hypothetical protein Ornrh_2162 [Ornithobacterium rhinotracheale DSM 15997]MCK0193360.1 gliding motility-associated C-terminal domain-containing protein [Ornithobacterium rhinotracheale]MCK0201213.1 gliding motility-associated C-terminal domain-containing protein [Ornithobacterium rhinotracheale]MCK0201669.1 gliding motility-associated C-terminal domain-containing protein [Ornithobact
MKLRYFLMFLFTGSLIWAQNKYPNDCVNYIQVCGNKNISLDVGGVGIRQEIDDRNFCNSHEHNSLWVKVTIKKSGNLGFILRPASRDIEEDYDFWVFGPNPTCYNLGGILRCSTTNPMGAGLYNNFTGLKPSEKDTYEGPANRGNSFVKDIQVKTGESYFIVIDRPHGNSAFTLEWTGDAEIENPMEEVTLNLNLENISLCDPENDGVETFDFESLNQKVTTDTTGLKFSYYASESDATIKNNPLNKHSKIRSGKYWCRVENIATGCFELVNFLIDLEGVKLSPATSTYCLNGKESVNVDLTSFSLSNQEGLKYTYYTRQDDLDNQRNSIQNPEKFVLKKNTKIYVHAQKSSCENNSFIELNVPENPSVKMLEEQVCLNTLEDGKIDLTLYESKINNRKVSFSFFSSKENLEQNKKINNPNQTPINLGKNVFFVKVENEHCSTTTTLTILANDAPKISTVEQSFEYCPEEFPIQISAQDGFARYVWDNKKEKQTLEVSKAGKYSVKIYNEKGCFTEQFFTIKQKKAPEISNIIYENYQIKILSNNTEELLYRINNGKWQEENSFKDLAPGVYQFYIKFKNGCMSAPKEFEFIKLNNVITTIKDGKNDYFYVPKINKGKYKNLKIYNRYGKVIYENPLKQAVKWEGKNLPQGDYWYILQIDDAIYKGNISIINYKK